MGKFATTKQSIIFRAWLAGRNAGFRKVGNDIEVSSKSINIDYDCGASVYMPWWYFDY